MSAKTPQESLESAWESHNRAEISAAEHDSAEYALLTARRRVAERFPGCARAILHPDTAQNWDRGRLVQEELKSTENAGFGGVEG